MKKLINGTETLENVPLEEYLSNEALQECLQIHETLLESDLDFVDYYREHPKTNQLVSVINHWRGTQRVMTQQEKLK